MINLAEAFVDPSLSTVTVLDTLNVAEALGTHIRETFWRMIDIADPPC